MTSTGGRRVCGAGNRLRSPSRFDEIRSEMIAVHQLQFISDAFGPTSSNFLTVLQKYDVPIGR
ncbi:hypothetical protein [Streptomyces sp. NPDC093094]|uniref:hypothetical protein n=1 Tax=Streptomyces sp. NPDC093094 TaxID=3366026 RepID=UPI0038135EB9